MFQRLVIASHNPGKLREIAALIAPLGIEAISAGTLGLPEPEETEDSFAGNAILKAEAALQGSGLAALSDDSGLCVEALGGAPGIYSARWAGADKDFAFAMERVRQELGDNPNRRAFFICVLALAVPGEKTRVFEGRIDGTLVFPPRGARGFGYDPIFLPEGDSETCGEMDPAKKHATSHRAKAFAKFLAYVTPHPNPLPQGERG